MVRVESQPVYCGQGPSRTYAERGCYLVRMGAYQWIVPKGGVKLSEPFPCMRLGHLFGPTPAAVLAFPCFRNHPDNSPFAERRRLHPPDTAHTFVTWFIKSFVQNWFANHVINSDNMTTVFSKSNLAIRWT